MRRLRVNLVFIFLLLVSHAICSCHSSRGKIAHTYYRVVRVVDGDTFWIDDGSEKGKKVRLIGVDAPETRKSQRKVVGRYGAEAKSFLTTLLLDKKVRMEYDVDPVDRYGRTLAYVYLEDGTFVNAELLRRGYAMALTVPPNVRFAEQFVRYQIEAREHQRGLWRK